MSDPDDALTVALDLARALRDTGITYAIGGALAFGVWAVPRATLDVDVNVFINDDDLPKLVHCLQRLGISLDETGARQQMDASGLIIVSWRGLRVDLFTPSIPFAWEAARTRVEIQIQSESFSFLSRESLAVFKLLFYRPKDIGDLAQMVAFARGQIDTDFVRSRIVEMLGEDDPRVERWDRIVVSGGTAI
jgi:hypothetical protein